ncbi:MAG: PP2C family protein-serine/threonine phosphatase [Erysipelotrichaceae bacterium]|nr:PP2C family protein-serine/threonine phosphatase [Erysipelotrichaceae bacterium]
MEVQQTKSLKRKIFNATIQISVIIMLIVGTLNLFQITSSIRQIYYDTVDRNAATMAGILDISDVYFLKENVLKTMAETGPRTEENHAYDYITETEQYRRVVEKLKAVCVGENSSFMTLVLPDPENMRFIYLADGDAFGYTTNHVSYPGDVYSMNEEEKASLLEHKNYIPAYNYDYDEHGTKTVLYSAGRAVIDHADLSIVAFAISDLRAEKMFMRIFPVVMGNLAILAAAIIVLAILVMIMGNAYIVWPLNKLSTAARTFINNRKNQKQNDVAYFKALGIRSQDEIEQLARSMSAMEKDLISYENEIVTLTKDKERIRTELSLARNIQHDTLPTTFPPFPEREDIDIYAVIDPAREVGGDFYDLFLVDDDHLALVVADVSGKGIPAALFMMVSKILINTTSQSELSPARVLAKVNELLCSNNKEEMFVTVWLAIVDLKTGIVTHANAGHENPLVCHNGEWSYIMDKHGLVLSALDGIQYTDYTLQLQDGDWLFQYSDGVPEAANTANELFGDERLLESCRKASLNSTAGFLKSIQIDIDEFVGEAEQFDDITMLAYRFHKKEGSDNGNN